VKAGHGFGAYVNGHTHGSLRYCSSSHNLENAKSFKASTAFTKRLNLDRAQTQNFKLRF